MSFALSGVTVGCVAAGVSKPGSEVEAGKLVSEHTIVLKR